MSKAKDARRPLGRTEQKGLVDGPSGKIGWEVAVLVIIGTALGLLCIALLAVGLLMH